jgi:hypothetical protein
MANGRIHTYIHTYIHTHIHMFTQREAVYLDVSLWCMEDRLLSLCMGMHPRLGKDSWISRLVCKCMYMYVCMYMYGYASKTRERFVDF